MAQEPHPGSWVVSEPTGTPTPTPAPIQPVDFVLDELEAPIAVPDAATLAEIRSDDQVATIMDGRAKVEAARAAFEEELRVLNASGRAAADIPAKIRRSPAKAAAVVGGLGFLALKGPQRLFGAGRRAVFGRGAALPDSMLPDEIERTLRKLGPDGDRVRGALERDFAAYATKAQKDRKDRRNLLLLALVQPLAVRGGKAVADWLFAPDARSFQERLEAARSRLDQGRAGILGAKPTDDAATTSTTPPDPVDPAR